MNQSVYKRDFRDPRDIASLWKFLLNENVKSNFEYNAEIDGKAKCSELSIKRHESELNYKDDNARTKSESCVIKDLKQSKNVVKAKSMSILPSADRKVEEVNFLE